MKQATLDKIMEHLRAAEFLVLEEMKQPPVSVTVAVGLHDCKVHIWKAMDKAAEAVA